MTTENRQPLVVAVATHNQHLVTHISQKLKSVGLAAIEVLPTPEAIQGLIRESQSGIVMLDALQNGTEPLALAKVLAESRPLAKVVILGGKADVALVAKSILAKASQFLLDSAPSGEFGKAINDLVESKPPSEECLFGRVWAELPVPTGKEDSFRTPSGRRLTTEEAIKQCDQFGIVVDEIAKYLRTPIALGERVTKKARTIQKPSVVSEVLVAVTPKQGMRVPSMRALGGAVVVALVALAVIQFHAGEPKRYVITGEVTYQGKPVPVGLIKFAPQGMAESESSIVAGTIREGRYAVRRGHGSSGGSYKVQISGFTGVPKKVGAMMDNLGEQLFSDVTRSAEVPCSDFTFNVRCD